MDTQIKLKIISKSEMNVIIAGQAPGTGITQPANDDLTWETTNQ